MKIILKKISNSLQGAFREFNIARKNTIAIFHRDIISIKKNYAALIIVGGLFFIPALYAWVNIGANWDPYANTGEIRVAVVIKDQGTTFNNTRINIGDDISDSLVENETIGWEVVSDYQGNYGLQNGDYYALIEIPSNFSKNLVSYASTCPTKPKIIYRANEKANAIATKITDVAKTKLTQSIKEEIIKTINKEIMVKMNDLGAELKNNKNEVLEFISIVNNANQQLNFIQNQIGYETRQIEVIQNLLSQTVEHNNDMNTRINNIKDINSSTRTLISTNQDSINSTSTKLSEEMKNLNTYTNNLNSKIEDLKTIIESEETKKSTLEILDTIIFENKSLNSTITYITSEVDSFIIDDETSTRLISLLNSADSENQQIDHILNSLRTNIESGTNTKVICDNLDIIIATNKITTKSIIQSYNTFNNSVLPLINTSSNNLIFKTRQTDNYLDTLSLIQPQLLAVSNFGISMGNVTNSQLMNINSRLTDAKYSLEKVQEVTIEIDEETINSAIELMSKDPEIIADFLANPITVEEVDIYGSNPFGVGLTPFYTVLGIWVGILLMSALLTTEVYPFFDNRKLSITQMHFGKMLTFLLIAFIQTLICLIGNIVLLGVRPENVPLFFFLGVYCCIVFTIIIFTLVSIFGNVGKAIAVIIMVFQIAGSGGIYPIETNPAIFGILQPLWPFTYAIDAFRQAISGPKWTTTLYDIQALTIFLLVFLLFGFIKKYIYHITEWFEEEFKKAEL
jgi:putative membrane protein